MQALQGKLAALTQENIALRDSEQAMRTQLAGLDRLINASFSVPLI